MSVEKIWRERNVIFAEGLLLIIQGLMFTLFVGATMLGINLCLDYFGEEGAKITSVSVRIIIISLWGLIISILLFAWVLVQRTVYKRLRRVFIYFDFLEEETTQTKDLNSTK